MKRIFLGISLPVIILVAVFINWANQAVQPMEEALQALQATSTVVGQDADWIVFEPAQGSPTTGLILYPGGKVDARAYAPLASAIAAQGYLVVITPMPLNLAVFNPGEAGEVIRAFPHIQKWVVGGHSLGGSMAASYAADHPEQVDGVVLWAAYPAEGDSLVGTGLPVVSVYATQDGLTTEQKIADSRDLLPPDTTWVVVEGGNHAQFGWYGAQPGDLPAAISREDQQDQIAMATTAFLKELVQLG